MASQSEGLPRDKRITFQISSFRYSAEFPGTVTASSFINAVVKHTFILRATGKRDVTLSQTKAYEKKRDVSEAKLADLKKMQQYIPAEYRPFYMYIISGNPSL